MTQRNVNNIVRLYAEATPAEVAQGRDWYQRAREQCIANADAVNIPLTTYVAVVAALSPNNKWERNLTDALKLCAAFLSGSGFESVSVSTYGAMKEKAWGILEDGPSSNAVLIEALRGQKIVSFFRCILGENTCCVDGHALNIWRNKRVPLSDNSTTMTPKRYKEVAADYTRAANLLGLKAYEVQAVTWVVWRRIHGIS